MVGFGVLGIGLAMAFGVWDSISLDLRCLSSVAAHGTLDLRLCFEEDARRIGDL